MHSTCPYHCILIGLIQFVSFIYKNNNILSFTFTLILFYMEGTSEMYLKLIILVHLEYSASSSHSTQ